MGPSSSWFLSKMIMPFYVVQSPPTAGRPLLYKEGMQRWQSPQRAPLTRHRKRAPAPWLWRGQIRGWITGLTSRSQHASPTGLRQAPPPSAHMTATEPGDHPLQLSVSTKAPSPKPICPSTIIFHSSPVQRRLRIWPSYQINLHFRNCLSGKLSLSQRAE